MASLPPVVILDRDDTIINYTGMAEDLWRVICDESAGTLGLDGRRLHAALMVERVAFWADPKRNRLGRHNLLEASRLIVASALATLGVNDEAQAVTLSRLYHERRHELVHGARRGRPPARRHAWHLDRPVWRRTAG